MKRLTPIRLTVGLASLMLAQSGWAIGTDAGTVVENTAVLDYSIGGTPQTQITSAVSDFTVDRKVDLTVTGDQSTNYIVAPLSVDTNAANELRYKLKNEGNSTQAFEISVGHLSSEDFDAENCLVEVQDDTNVNVAGPVAITATPPIVDVPEDKEYNILVTCDMPDLGTAANEVSDGELSTLEVLAKAVVSTADNTVMTESATDTEDAIDTVLADDIGGAADVAGGNGGNGGAAGDRNAMHSDTQTYEINAPELSVVKTSAVITDPFNCTQSNDATDTTVTACAGTPKRIPGAVIEYTITITNISDAAATGVKISDTIDTDGAGGSGPNVVTFVPASIVINDSGTAETSSFVDPLVTADGLTVPAQVGVTPGTATVSFRVKID